MDTEVCILYTPEERAAVDVEMDAYLAVRDKNDCVMVDSPWHNSNRKVLMHRIQDLNELYAEGKGSTQAAITLLNLIMYLKGVLTLSVNVSVN